MEEPFIGEIAIFGFNFAPRGWAQCDGHLLPISQNQALFSLLGTTYGGDGRTTFGLPDLRGRIPMHYGAGQGLSARHIGQKIGQETVSLNVNQMPAHKHDITLTSITATLKAVNDEGDQKKPGGHTIANSSTEFYSEDTPNTPMHADSIEISGSGTCENTGGSQFHNNIQPSLVVNYCIALIGLYPPRN